MPQASRMTAELNLVAFEKAGEGWGIFLMFY